MLYVYLHINAKEGLRETHRIYQFGEVEAVVNLSLKFIKT